MSIQVKSKDGQIKSNQVLLIQRDLLKVADRHDSVKVVNLPAEH